MNIWLKGMYTEHHLSEIASTVDSDSELNIMRILKVCNSYFPKHFLITG